MRTWKAMVIAGVMGSACAMATRTVVRDTPINPSPRALQPRAPGAVEVYTSGPPTRAHVDVALLEATQSFGRGPSGMGIILDNLRERAGAMGCDALVLGAAIDRPGGGTGTGVEPIDPHATIREATCVVYTGESR
jgi:hypothetical protein